MMNRSFSRRFVIAALVTTFSYGVFSQTEDESVSLEFARKELEAGKVTLIDVREPQEHATGIAKGALLLSMRQIGFRMSEIPKDPNRPVLLICNTQNRSSATFKFLRDKGYTNVRYVLGGMSEWNRRGWPVAKP